MKTDDQNSHFQIYKHYIFSYNPRQVSFPVYLLQKSLPFGDLVWVVGRMCEFVHVCVYSYVCVSLCVSLFVSVFFSFLSKLFQRYVRLFCGKEPPTEEDFPLTQCSLYDIIFQSMWFNGVICQLF